MYCKTLNICSTEIPRFNKSDILAHLNFGIHDLQWFQIVPYFFGYKTGIFPAEMTAKNCTRLISKAVGSMPSFRQAQLIMDYMV